MKKYINEVSAKKLLVVGGSMYCVSLIINFMSVSSVYNKADNCLGKAPSCTLSTEQIAGKIAMFTGYIGVAILIAGLLILIIVVANKKKQ